MEKLRKFLSAALKYVKIAMRYLGELSGILEQASKAVEEKKPEDKPE